MRDSIRAGWAIAVMTAVLACGGGGGGGGGSDNPTGPHDLLAGKSGDFEGSNVGASWQFYNSAGTATSSVVDCTADGFAGKCMTLGPGTFWTPSSPFDFAFGYLGMVAAPTPNNLSLVSGGAYELKFKARGSQAGMRIQCNVRHVNPDHYSLLQAVDLTTMAADYSLKFTGDMTDTARLDFYTGVEVNDGGAIQIDDIQLIAQ